MLFLAEEKMTPDDSAPVSSPSARRRLTPDQVDSLVTRLTKTNTTTAKKAVLWSAPRTEYEYQFKTTARLKTADSYWDRYGRLDKHYPGSWRVADSQQIAAILQRLSQPTYAQMRRADDNISRRRVIEAHRVRIATLDVGTPRDQLEALERPRFACSAPVRRDDVTCSRRRARATAAPFDEWRDAESYTAAVKRL